MTKQKITFGMLHPVTGALAKEGRPYDDQRIKSAYTSEHGNTVFEWPYLDIIKGIVPGEDDGYDEFQEEQAELGRDTDTWPEVESDFREFVPVAFIKETAKALGVGTKYLTSQKIMRVEPKDEYGKGYDLKEL